MVDFFSRIKALLFPSSGSRASNEPDDSIAMPSDFPGRNDLCYCNSGRKYKKCHLSVDKKRQAAAYRQSIHMRRQEKIGAFVPTNEIGIARRGFAMLNKSLRKKSKETSDVSDVD